MAKQFYVVGGEYQDTQFKDLLSGQELEKLGPFTSYDDAKRAWADKAWSTVDTCTARYQIVEQ